MLVTVLTVAEVVYVVVLTIWILFEKRPPVSTIAWILALVALPYVGFIVFFFLGPRHLERKRLNLRRALPGSPSARFARYGRGATRDATSHGSTLAKNVSARRVDDPRIAQLDSLAISLGEPAVDICEEVRILHDAASTYDAIETAIAEAKHHVHVSYYIFDSGVAGTRLTDALVKAAKRGVTVRVLVDHVGSLSMKGAMIDRMRDSGIKFARFNPVRMPRLRSRINFRNHRKIVVCDGVVGFTGGINISDDYVASVPTPTEGAGQRRRRGHDAPWRDTHLRLKGDAVRWLQLTFLDDWHFATGYLARDAEYFPPPSGTGEHTVQIVASGPDRTSEPIQRLYFAAIGLAQTRVLVTTPYFVPDDAILTALTTAALRGVDVRILVPRRSDSLVVTAAARSYYDGVLAAGGRVFEYQPTMIHAKTLVVDDYFSSVGTANMDNRSFRLNFEVTAVIYGKHHADELAEQFRHDVQSSKEIKKRSREHVPLHWRAAEAGARLLSPLL